MTVDQAVVTAGLARVAERIHAAGGDPEQVTVVAVTKGWEADAVVAARVAGARHVGENYAQEMLAKIDQLSGSHTLAGTAPTLWHFIGGLQRNKVRSLAPHVTLWESVDRASLGEEIAKRAPGARVLVQVNISGEAAKHGCAPTGTADLVARLRDLDLEVRGLMGVASAGDQAIARAQFGRLAEQARRLDLDELSMGMSADLEAAVAEGATIVRVGSALFGARPPD